MAVSLIQSKSTKGVGVTQVSCTFNFTPTNGNHILVGVASWARSWAAGNVTDNQSHTYTLRQAGNSTNVHCAVYDYLSITASPTFTIAGKPTGGANDTDIAIHEFQGTITAYDTGANTSGGPSSTNRTGVTPTTAQADELLFGVITSEGRSGASNLTGSGFTKRQDITTTSNMPIVTGDFESSSTGTFEMVDTNGDAGSAYAGAIAAYKVGSGSTDVDKTYPVAITVQKSQDKAALGRVTVQKSQDKAALGAVSVQKSQDKTYPAAITVQKGYDAAALAALTVQAAATKAYPVAVAYQKQDIGATYQGATEVALPHDAPYQGAVTAQAVQSAAYLGQVAVVASHDSAYQGALTVQKSQEAAALARTVVQRTYDAAALTRTVVQKSYDRAALGAVSVQKTQTAAYLTRVTVSAASGVVTFVANKYSGTTKVAGTSATGLVNSAHATETGLYFVGATYIGADADYHSASSNIAGATTQVDAVYSDGANVRGIAVSTYLPADTTATNNKITLDFGGNSVAVRADAVNTIINGESGTGRVGASAFSSGSTSPITGSIVTQYPGSLILACLVHNGDNTVNYGTASGWTNMVESGTTGADPNITIMRWYRSALTPGTYNFSATMTASKNWVLMLLEYVPAGSISTPQSKAYLGAVAVQKQQSSAYLGRVSVQKAADAPYLGRVSVQRAYDAPALTRVTVQRTYEAAALARTVVQKSQDAAALTRTVVQKSYDAAAAAAVSVEAQGEAAYAASVDVVSLSSHSLPYAGAVSVQSEGDAVYMGAVTAQSEGDAVYMGAVTAAADTALPYAGAVAVQSEGDAAYAARVVVDSGTPTSLQWDPIVVERAVSISASLTKAVGVIQIQKSVNIKERIDG